MVTAILIVFAVLVLFGTCCLVNAALNGCCFAWIWLAMGGLGNCVELFAAVVGAIIQGTTEG